MIIVIALDLKVMASLNESHASITRHYCRRFRDGEEDLAGMPDAIAFDLYSVSYFGGVLGCLLAGVVFVCTAFTCLCSSQALPGFILFDKAV